MFAVDCRLMSRLSNRKKYSSIGFGQHESAFTEYKTEWNINNYKQEQRRIQDFPQGGAPTPKVGVLTYFFGQKLHENERIWTPRGAYVPGAPP